MRTPSPPGDDDSKDVFAMSLHRSLKTKPAALNQHRNVLTRAERIEKLMAKGAFDPDSDSPIGIVKVASRKAVTKKKKKTKKDDDSAD
jgi:small basic protein (TIGR04137 family)